MINIHKMFYCMRSECVLIKWKTKNTTVRNITDKSQIQWQNQNTYYTHIHDCSLYICIIRWASSSNSLITTMWTWENQYIEENETYSNLWCFSALPYQILVPCDWCWSDRSSLWMHSYAFSIYIHLWSTCLSPLHDSDFLKVYCHNIFYV